MKFEFKPIGIIHTPYKTARDAPIQSRMSDEIGSVELFEKYAEGLDDIEGFSHITLLYVFHKRTGYSLKVTPFLDTEKKGVFATRAPARPNQIGLSVVELLERKGNFLTVKGVDMLDGTPILDIKPYIPPFDIREKVRIGWLEGKL